jgi:hypothetical protein
VKVVEYFSHCEYLQKIDAADLKKISLKYQYILPCKELDVEKNQGRVSQSKRKFLEEIES